MNARIGFVGAGNMGGAIIRGLAQDRTLSISATDLNRAKLDELARECGISALDTPQAVAEASDYLVLAVKPQHLAGLLADLAPGFKKRPVVLVSIAAGFTSAKIKTLSGGMPVVRVMPNTPALVGAGAFAVCLEDTDLTEEAKAFAAALFKAVGKVYVLPESQIDAFTAVMGSGPAYVFYFMQAFIQAAIELGFHRDTAAEMVATLFEGSAKMAAVTGEHVVILREMVSSPSGTTIRGLNHLDRTATRGHIIDAILEGWRRCVELSSK